MRYLLALDQGTTSSRGAPLRRALLGMAQEEHPQIYPEPGWVEHDPELLWQTQVRTARRVLTEHGVCGREIAAIHTPVDGAGGAQRIEIVPGIKAQPSRPDGSLSRQPLSKSFGT